VLIKFITRSLRPLGMFIIFSFAVVCIFGSIIVRDIDSGDLLGNFLNYTNSFESKFYDFRMKAAINSKFMSKDIVLVKIDDYSLEKIGFWPIPRNNYAQMIEKLQAFGAKVIAMDVLFPERSPDAAADLAFGESIKKFQTAGGRVFIGYSLGTSEQDSLAEAPLEMLDDAVLTRNVPQSDIYQSRIGKFTFPIQEILTSGVGLGYLTAAQDSDGIFRQYQLIINVDTIYYGSLGFNAFEAYSGSKNTFKIFADNTGVLELDTKPLEISRTGETKIRYIGGESNFDSIALYDLLQADASDEKFRSRIANKIIFIGSTATGAHDLRPTPIDSKLPGVYAHMNMAHMLVHKFFYQYSNASVTYSLYLLLAGMLIFLVVQRIGSPLLDAVVLFSVVGGCYYVDRWYFIPQGYELKLFYCFFCFIACYSWNTFLNFYESNKEKKQIRGTFARYVAPTIVDEMLKDPEKLHVGGTKMDITCLFSDVRDFTKISEGMSATELAHSLNMYMGAMTDIVFDTKGTLDKYIGDAIVAIWGAPLQIGNHAQHAVEGAIKMMETLPKINEEFVKLNRPIFNVGIGLNSGECSVGNMGSNRIFSYTALGDNMNLGARLESLCKYYGAQILISEMTLERLDLTNIKTRPIDKVIVKGKTTSVAIFEVLHPHHWMSKDPESLSFYLTAYSYFQKKNFSAAMDVFNQVLMGNENDKPAKRFSDLCKKYIEHPELVTDDFEITTMTEK
jgi:adenylate cyclase